MSAASGTNSSTGANQQPKEPAESPAPSSGRNSPELKRQSSASSTTTTKPSVKRAPSKESITEPTPTTRLRFSSVRLPPADRPSSRPSSPTAPTAAPSSIVAPPSYPEPTENMSSPTKTDIKATGPGPFGVDHRDHGIGLPLPGLSGKPNGAVGNLLKGPVDDHGNLKSAALMVGVKLDLEAEVHLTARVRGDVLVGLY